MDRRTLLQSAAVAAAAPLGMFPAQAAESPAQTGSSVPTAGGPPFDITRRLAEYAVSVSLDSYPQDVRHQGERTLLNWVGAALGGSQHEAVFQALKALTPFSGPPKAQLLGRPERIDALTASLINGIAGHVLDFDDTHLKTIIHPAGSVAPALLALAQHQIVRGDEFLNALIIGVETQCRIGNAVYPDHYDAGWHITGTCGVLGAAVACGRVLRLTQEQMVSAIGIAASQPIGLKIQFGSMTKSFHPGRAAQSGLTAALLAQQDFTAAAASLEGKDGWGRAVSRKQDWQEVTGELGTRFESALNTYKPFPCGIVTHPAIDAALQLRSEAKLSPEAIRRITLRANPLVLSLTGKTAPETGLDGKFSIYHCIAAAMIDGAVGERQFSNAMVTDPKVAALRQRVEVVTDPKISTEQCTLTVALTDGRTLERHIEHALGSLERPMSDQQLESKFRDLAEGVLPTERVARLIDNCWNLSRLNDASEVCRVAATA